MTMTPVELKSALESIIYAADEPATLEQLANVLGEEKHVVRAALDELVASYANDERGVEIRAVAGGYRVYTKPQHHDLVRRFIKSLRPPLRLTMPALETLAVIAYKQPVTQPEIQEIRGVNCAGVIETLLEKRLIVTAGRKQVIGRPILYRTSKDFLMRFGLGDLDELPSLKEFEALAREALGADDGISVEGEPPEGEPLGELSSEVPAREASATASGVILSEARNLSYGTSSPDAVSPSRAVGEISGESRAAPDAEPTSRVSEEGASRDPESLVRDENAGANSGSDVAGEEPGESADRAAKKAAPGSQ
jgi:segregation and condensation protein B